MKNYTFLSVPILIILISIVVSCKKPTNNDAPVITIISPIEGQALVDTAYMKFTVTDNSGLDSCFMTLSNSSGAIYYSNNFLAPTNLVKNKTTFSFEYTQPDLPSTLETGVFKIIAVDIDNNRVSKSVNITMRE